MTDAEREAERLFAALEAGRPAHPPSDDDREFDDRRAYVVAAALEHLRVSRGGVVVGRKIGFTNPALMARYGVSTPIVGAIYDRGVSYATGATEVAVGHLQQPRIEPEIQLHFARAPRAGAGPDEVLACVDWIAHGFEFVQCVYPGFRFTSSDAIASGSLHALLVLGPPLPTAGTAGLAARLRDFTVVLRGDAGQQARGRGADVLGSPLLAVAAMPTPPAAGDIVSTGSLTDALPVRPGETWTTELEGIELPGLTVHLV